MAGLAREQAVDALNPCRVGFRLREPWPDFLIFLGTNTTGAGLVSPKAYLDELFYKQEAGAKQALERDPKRREDLRHQNQRPVHERAMVVPLYQASGLIDIGPRVAAASIDLIPAYQWSGTYDEGRLKP